MDFFKNCPGTNTASLKSIALFLTRGQSISLSPFYKHKDEIVIVFHNNILILKGVSQTKSTNCNHSDIFPLSGNSISDLVASTKFDIKLFNIYHHFLQNFSTQTTLNIFK